MASGFYNLAAVIQSRMQTVSGAPAVVMDIGSVGKDYSLKTNKFPVAIPKADYLICRHLTFDGAEDKKTGRAGDPSHDHVLKGDERLRRLSPGDRVLVAWVGTDPCVIDVLVSGKAL